MKTIRSILVLANSEMKNTRALRRGIALAKATGARLCLGMIVHDPRIDSLAMDLQIMRLAQRALLQERREWLEERKTRARLPVGRITAQAVWSPRVVETFLRMVRDTSANLVIKDISCADAAFPGLMTPMDWKLLRLCPAPLMLMSPSGPVLPKRVVAAVDTASAGADPDGLNLDIVGAGQEVAKSAGADVHLASAFPALSAASRVYPMVEQALRDAEQQHTATLEALRKVTGISQVHCHGLQGDTLHALGRFVKAHKIDMVVVGSIYRRGFERLLLGSTAEQILLHAPCDVLLVKPHRVREEALANLRSA